MLLGGAVSLLVGDIVIVHIHVLTSFCKLLSVTWISYLTIVLYCIIL